MDSKLVANDAISASRTFQDTVAKNYHKAFWEPAKWDAQRAQYTVKGLTDTTRLDTVTADFEQAMQSYQRELKDLRTQKGQSCFKIDLTQIYSWDDVIRAAELAEEDYVEAGKGFKGAPRRLFRALGERRDTFLPWLDLLPNNTYTSILCGSLKIIFGAAAYRKDKRERILQAFRDLPSIIQYAQDRRANFREDAKLRRQTIELYVSVLSTSIMMIQWLLAKDVIGHLKSVVGGSKMDHRIDVELKGIEDCVAAIKARAETIRDELFVEMHQGLRTMSPKINVIDERSRMMSADMQSITNTTRDIDSNIVNMGKTLEARKQVDDERFLSNATAWREIGDKIEKLEKSEQARNDMLAFIADTFKQAYWMFEPPPYSQPERHAKAIISTSTLKTVLAVPSYLVSRDAESIKSYGYLINESSQSSMYMILASQRFQIWLNVNCSRLLLVNGSDDEYVSTSISPLSLLVDILSEALQSIPSARFISHFCALHTRASDDVVGPQGIMRSLIYQLLGLFSFEFDFMSSTWSQGIEQRDLHWLCELFSRLLLDLPSGVTLFCLIDDISVYEGHKWFEQTAFLLTHLSQFVERPTLRATVKILVTHPGTSRLSRQYLRFEDQYAIPRDADSSDQLLNVSQVGVALRRSFNSLRPSRSANALFPSYDTRANRTPVNFEDGNE